MSTAAYPNMCHNCMHKQLTDVKINQDAEYIPLNEPTQMM